MWLGLATLCRPCASCTLWQRVPDTPPACPPTDATPFQGGNFKVKLVLPSDFPNAPPKGAPATHSALDVTETTRVSPSIDQCSSPRAQATS